MSGPVVLVRPTNAGASALHAALVAPADSGPGMIGRPGRYILSTMRVVGRRCESPATGATAAPGRLERLGATTAIRIEGPSPDGAGPGTTQPPGEGAQDAGI